MSDIETLRTLLTEAAGQSDVIEALLESDEGDFELQLTTNRVIGLEFDQGSGRLMFVTDLGIPPEDRRAEVLEILLGYNALWRETGGVRAATAGKNEPALLMVDVFIFGLSADQIVEVVENFSEKAELWSEYVTARQLVTESSSDEFLLRI